MRIIEDKQPLWPYLLLSLILHVVILVVILPKAMSVPQFAEKKIEIIPIEAVPDMKKFRIADIQKPKVQTKPKKSKFLGMYDSAVKDETVGVSRRQSKRRQGSKSKSRSAGQFKKARKPAGKDKLFAFDRSLFEKERAQAEQKPSPSGGALDDFYPDFKRGVHTYLNVLRHPDVEYFVRLKRAFKIAFNPTPSLREHFSHNRVTRGSVDVVLGVSVDGSGNLRELFVFRSSSIPSYDREAMRTVRSSAPFSTPPSKFIDDDGLLRMSWTFTVYL
jgi:TonB family protein